MSDAPAHHCSFCGAQQSVDTPLIAGIDGHICESCVALAHQVVNSWGRKRVLAGPLRNPPRPREITVIDTRNILFLAGGAFSGLERLLERRLAPKRTGIGFHAEPAVKAEQGGEQNLLEETHPDDLRHFSLIPEFIGRFPVIIALHDLDEADLVRILTEPKNALVRQYQQLFAFEGVQLELTPEALTAAACKAIEGGTGARGLRSVLEALLKRTMFDLPSMANIERCRVDKKAVLGESEIHLEQRIEGENKPERSVG